MYLQLRAHKTPFSAGVSAHLRESTDTDFAVEMDRHGSLPRVRWSQRMERMR